MSSSKSLRSLATAMVTAGITKGLSLKLELPEQAKGLTQHFQQNTINSMVSGITSTVIEGGNLGDNLVSALKDIPINTIAATLSEQIGNLYTPENGGTPKIDTVTHKALHGLVGGLLGAFLDEDDRLGGAINGAVSSIAVECLAEILSSHMNDVAKELREQNPNMSLGQVSEALTEVLKNNANIAKLSIATVALLTGQNVEVAIATSKNAIDNNFLIAALPWLVGAGMTAWMAYDVIDAYKTGGIEAAAKQLGIEVVMITTGIGVTKAVYKIGKIAYPSMKAAINAVLQQNPGLKMMLGEVGGNLIQTGEKITNSKLSKKVIEFDKKLDRGIEKIGEKIGITPNIHEKDLYKFKSEIFTQEVSWKAPVGTKQTYKVIQRNDIDWNLVRTTGNPKYRGLTNKEAAVRYGAAPQLKDGTSVTVHHIGQNAKGPLVEASTNAHKGGQKSLHSQFGPGQKNPENPVDHGIWSGERKAYWKFRGNDK